MASVRPQKPNGNVSAADNASAVHLISTPLAHVSDDFAPKAWVKFADVPALKAPGVRHLHGSVVAVDPAKKSATISKTGSEEQFDESYDYLVAGSGLKRAWPVVAQSLDRSSYLAEVGAHIESVKDAAREGVVVIGGGMWGHINFPSFPF